MTKILMILAGIVMLAGAIFYNPVRKKMAGIIGVGGSYFVLLGVLLIINFKEVIGEAKDNKVVIIVPIVFILIAIAYLVFAMLRCETVGQRIFLPFAACLIGFGFAWRLLGAIVFHIPMESGKVEKASAFPYSIESPEGENFTLEDDSGDNAAYYCSRTGQRAQFRDVDFEDGGCPTGWRRA